MGNSKIDYDGRTLIDLTGDTVTKNTLARGTTAHGADGEPIEGEMPIENVLYVEQTLTEDQKTQARSNIGAASTEEVGQLSDQKLNKSGGTLTGKIILPTGSADAGFANSEDVKIFGYGGGYFRFGDANCPAQIRGSGTNPMFNNKKILVEGDITDGLLTVEKITVGDSGETENVPVTGLSLDLTTYSAKVGDGFYINPVIIPNNATNKAVTWKSNAESVATVNSSGYVECIAEGDATITCTTSDGGFTATCAVSVAEGGGEPEVTLSSISATYSGGDVVVGTAVSDLTGIVVTAHYSDGSTATVTDYTLNGTIAEGSNTITVRYGGKTTTFTVTGVTESTGGKVQLSTLGITAGFVKKDGTIASLSGAYHVTFPYIDGVFVSTGTNKAWNQTTYPPIQVYDNGTYNTPTITMAENQITVGGKAVTQCTATLSGYGAGATVYVSLLSGDTDGSVETAMDNADIYYYNSGGAE